MEELKLLVDVVAHLPQMALWVIAAFFAYKVICIGSVYGVIRLLIEKTHSWLTQPKHESVDVRMLIDGKCISGTKEGLLAQLDRVRMRPSPTQSYKGAYLHSDDVEWLRDAITAKLEETVARKEPA